MPTRLRNAFLLVSLAASSSSAMAQPCAVAKPFVKVQNGKLCLGDQRFRPKGATFIPGRYLTSYGLQQCPALPAGETCEGFFHWQTLHDFDSAALDAEMEYLRGSLALNTIRIVVPAPGWLTNYVLYAGWEPLTDHSGAITPVYLGHLQALVQIASAHGLKVQLALLFDQAGDKAPYFDAVAYSRALTYLDSVIPSFAQDPTILSYEITSEFLTGWEPQPSQRNLAQLDFQRRAIEHTRLLDPDHMITSGEVSVPASLAGSWRYPTPELSVMDPDGSGGLPPYSLAQLVDYLSPHFYDYETGPDTSIATTVEAIRAASAKPLVMGEVGWHADQSETGNHYNEDKANYFTPQLDYFTKVYATVRPGLVDGFLPWAPLPLFDLMPGEYDRIPGTHNIRYTGDPPRLELQLPDGRLRRILGYEDYWELYYHDTAVPGTPLKLMPAGTYVRRALVSRFDFGGEGTADAATFDCASARWSVRNLGDFDFGQPGDRPVAADYDGDGRFDAAVVRDVAGIKHWWVSGSINDQAFGSAADIPVAGDYTGDGLAEIAVFRPSNGTWYIRGVGNFPFGGPGDRPVPADYDGDGDMERAVFRPSEGNWYVEGIGVFTYGIGTDIPVPADYTGDGKADLAVVRASAAGWQWFIAGGGWNGQVWGMTSDVPVPADYDGDGRADVAIYRPSTQEWNVWIGGTLLAFTHGSPGAKPVAGVYAAGTGPGCP